MWKRNNSPTSPRRYRLCWWSLFSILSQRWLAQHSRFTVTTRKMTQFVRVHDPGLKGEQLSVELIMDCIRCWAMMDCIYLLSQLIIDIDRITHPPFISEGYSWVHIRRIVAAFNGAQDSQTEGLLGLPQPQDCGCWSLQLLALRLRADSSLYEINEHMPLLLSARANKWDQENDHTCKELFSRLLLSLLDFPALGKLVLFSCDSL